MTIREIEPIEVAALVPQLVDHMIDVRRASYALRDIQVTRFRRKQLERFRVGVPHGSRIFVNDDLSEWMWIDTSGEAGNASDPGASAETELVEVRVKDAAEPWHDLLAEVTGGQPISCSIFPRGDSEGFFELLDQQETKILVAADLARVSALPEADRPLNRALAGTLKPDPKIMRKPRKGNIHLRGMGAAEIGGYVESILDSWSRHQAAVYPDTDVEYWRREGLAHVEAVLHDGVATPGNELLAIHTDSEAVGGIWAEVDGQCATLRYLYVYGPYRGNNYSREALIALAERLRAEGVRRIRAEMVPSQRHIIEVCLSVGFKIIERRVRISA
ncbi:MAG: GNAT family N-acetyltransferase [Ancrocorticia sp.]